MATLIQILVIVSAALVCVQSRSLENDVLDNLFRGIGKEDKFTGESMISRESLRLEGQVELPPLPYDRDSCRRGLGFANCRISWLG